MTAPIAWLIDTNVVSEMMRPRPESCVAASLDSIAGEGLGIASITVWEVLDGIGRFVPGRRRDNLADRFRDLLDDLFEDRIVDWSLADAQLALGSWKKGVDVGNRWAIIFLVLFSPLPAGVSRS